MRWSGILAMIVGILTVANPKVFREYSMSDIINGKKPSESVLKFNRVMGVVVILLGFLLLLGVI